MATLSYYRTIEMLAASVCLDLYAPALPGFVAQASCLQKILKIFLIHLQAGCLRYKTGAIK
jgi:hypothetical protein